MTWFVHVLLPVLLLAFSVWGLPSARGTYQQRSLIATLVLLAVALTIGAPAVSQALDRVLGVTSITTVLLVHLAIVGGVVCLTDFTHALCTGQAAWQLRPRHTVAAALAAALSVLYLGYMPHDASALDYTQSRGRTTEIVFLTLFYLWMLYVGVQVSALITGRSRQLRKERRPSGGIVLLAAGSVTGVLFATWRALYMITLLVTGSSIINTAEVISKYLMTTSILLFVAGAVTAPVTALLHTIRGLWVLHRLSPLWSDLTSSVPNVVLSQPPSTPWRQIRAGRVGVQVRRRAVEIRDATLTLAGHTPSDLMDRARTAVAATALPPSQAPFHAEALWLRAALALPRTDPPVSTASLNHDHSHDHDGKLEISRLVRLARAYRRPACPDLAPAPTDSASAPLSGAPPVAGPGRT
ncbi:hypothetical protein ABIA33_004701 [Streptacidiphilus sp. MAP12-16]|uniref:MAB_1171c family putative transporter n=1 Tax=Streptacidiphilus sp. MAP12-16 TaxID=3156300 RepID=UPI0035111ED9